MVSLISALLISIVAPAETLELTSTEYLAPPAAPSCGLLHQRELEREKVMREFVYLMGTLRKNERALVPLNCLMTNKFFMPKDTWEDDSVEVAVTAKISDEMRAEIKRIGFKNVFIRTDGPGFIWQSEAGQLPDEVSIIEDPDGQDLDIRYKTYLNAACERPLRPTTVEWIPQNEVPGMVNSWQVMAKLGGAQ
jgi:hypothetical protein